MKLNGQRYVVVQNVQLAFQLWGGLGQLNIDLENVKDSKGRSVHPVYLRDLSLL